jgi:hypothetical protein
MERSASGFDAAKACFQASAASPKEMKFLPISAISMQGFENFGCKNGLKL